MTFFSCRKDKETIVIFIKRKKGFHCHASTGSKESNTVSFHQNRSCTQLYSVSYVAVIMKRLIFLIVVYIWVGKRSGGGLQRGPGYQSGYTHTVCISCHNFNIIYILKETEAACRSGITTIYSGVQRGKATEARGKRSAEGESKIRDQRIPTRVFKYLRQNRGGSLQKLINLLRFGKGEWNPWLWLYKINRFIELTSQ